MIRNRKGFTLIELIITIVIIGILAAFAIPKYLDLVSNSAAGTARGVLGNLRSANSLLFASRIIGGSTTAYNWTSIVDNAQLQGVSYAVDTTNFIMTAGGYTYTFTLSPTQPAAPNTPATIYCTGAATW